MAFNASPSTWFGPGYSVADNEIRFGTADKGATARVTTITTVADVSSSLNGTYFDIADEDGPVRVWIDVGNTGSAPAVPAGGRLLEVDITADDTAAAVATAVAAALDADAKFGASSASDVVTATNATAGALDDGVDNGDSGFTAAIVTAGVDAVDNQTLPEVTDAQADPSTGDVRRVVWAFLDALQKSYQAKAPGDRPATMFVQKAATNLSTDGTTTIQFSVQFQLEQVDVELKAE